MVKNIKVWKVEFFKNDDENGGAMKACINKCSENEIVIHSQTKKNGRMWGNVTPNKLLTLLEKNYGIYEVITKFPHKVYFDIDKKGQQDPSFLNHIKNIILKYFPDANMAVSGSIKETKTSYHIILQNYVIHNEDERQHIKHLVKYICDKEEDSFDWKVYTKNRNMKCINQSKDDGRVQEILEGENPDFKTHCITCFVTDYSLPFSSIPENVKHEIMIQKANKTFDLGTLPKLTLSTPDTFNAETATPEEILSLLPLDKSFDHNYTHLVARYCYYHNIDFKTFLSWLEKKHKPLTNDIINKWNNHWNKLSDFPNVETSRMISILNHFYPHIKKDIHFRNFSQTFDLPQDKIQKIETISQQQFKWDLDYKYSIFNVGMGGGKTAQTISYLGSEPNFAWISPNRALAANTKKRFELEYIDVCNYQEVNAKNKKEGQLKIENRLIICLNSLHYINEINYDVIVIDEIETLLDKFLGDFLEQGTKQYKRVVWECFIKLLKNATKVFLLDAFITQKTIKFIQSLGGGDYVIYERIKEPQTRTIKYMENSDAMMKDIIDKLNNGLKLFIFYPYKRDTGKFDGMERVYKAICEATGKTGVFYNADVDDGIKAGLKDVNKSWGDKNFIITNNIITCGINYENLDFDYKYIFVASHNTPRDIIQVSYRARHLNSGIIKICYVSKMTQSNTWLNDCEKINCPLYNQLFNSILVERKAPLRRSFQLFCVKAHYKQVVDDFKISLQVEKELKHLLMNQQIGILYCKIPDIGDTEIIESKCIAQQATMLEKYMLKKYYFKKSFTNLELDDIENTLSDIWDNDYVFLFKRFGEILRNKDSLFNLIASENDLKHLFPINVKKTKLSNEVKQLIFKQFSFKYITAESTSQKILKEIYNTYFNKHVIKTEYDHSNSQNVNYWVEEHLYDYYDFAKQNLVLDSQTYMTYKEMFSENEENVIEI